MSGLHFALVVEMVIKFLLGDVLREECFCGKTFDAQSRVTIHFLYLLNIYRIEQICEQNRLVSSEGEMDTNKMCNSSDAPMKRDVFTALVMRNLILSSQFVQDEMMKRQPFLELIGLRLKCHHQIMNIMLSEAEKGHQGAQFGHRQSFVISSISFCVEPTKTCPSVKQPVFKPQVLFQHHSSP